MQKRYSQFEDFHNKIITMALAAQVPNGVELPGKRIKLFTSHDDANFIEVLESLNSCDNSLIGTTLLTGGIPKAACEC